MLSAGRSVGLGPKKSASTLVLTLSWPYSHTSDVFVSCLTSMYCACTVSVVRSAASLFCIQLTLYTSPR